MSVHDLQHVEGQDIEETHFVIQHDWLQAFRDVEKQKARNVIDEDEDAEIPEPTFFVGKRGPNQERCDYSTVYADPLMENFDVEQQFKVVNYNAEDRSITLKDLHSDIETTFYSRKLHFFGPHKSALLSIDGTEQAHYFVSSDEAGKVLLWNATKVGETNVLREVNGHLMDVNVCRFFPNGGILLTGGMDMSVRVWSIMETPVENVCTFVGHQKSITDLAIIDVGKEVLSASKDGTVRRWRCAGEQCIQTYQLDAGSAKAICLIPSKEAFAVACENNAVVVCSYKTGAPETLMRFRLNETFRPSALTIVNDQFLVVGSENGSLAVIDMESKALIKLINTKRNEVTCLKAIPEKELVAASFDDGSMVFYSYTTFKPLIELCNDTETVRDFVYVHSKFYTACRDGVVRMFTI